MYPVFYVSLLKKVPQNILTIETFQLKENDEKYEIKRIIDIFKTPREKIQYLIKWKGYTNAENIWEPEQNLKHYRRKLKQFL